SEDAQHRRQSHEGRHGEPVRQRDQSRDHAAGTIARKLSQTVFFRARGAVDHAITFLKAVLNLFISSCVPIEMRTWVGQLGQTRPMKTFSLRMPSMTSRGLRLQSTMKQLDCDLT